jgi:sec-independent protein translocase protein TatB
MLRPMFGMGFGEIVVILVIALIFLGPEKLPGAAKSISKGIRDLRKQTREIQTTIEADEHIGGAIRDLRSALRGEESPRPRPAPPSPPPGVPIPGEKPPGALAGGDAPPPNSIAGEIADKDKDQSDQPVNEPPLATADAETKPAVTLPPRAGERDDDAPADDDHDDKLAQLVRPAEGTVAKGS